MAESLVKKFEKNFENLKRYYAATGFRMEFPQFAAVIAILSALIAFVFFLMTGDLFVSIVAFIAFLTLAVIIPVSIRSNRIEEIEANLPDALKHMASILRAGGTTEDALDEVAHADYGPLSADLKMSLNQLKEGKPFDDVMFDASINSGSQLFKRTALIIVDARRAGAGLADVMDAIGDDARDLNRIKRERVSRTMMPVLFLAFSSLLLAPFIFGFAITIVCFIGTGIATADIGEGTSTTSTLGDLRQLLEVFIIIQSLTATVGIGIIREGKAFKYITYFPFAVAIALAIFLGGQWGAAQVIGGDVKC